MLACTLLKTSSQPFLPFDGPELSFQWWRYLCPDCTGRPPERKGEKMFRFALKVAVGIIAGLGFSFVAQAAGST
jgi:hypothetical protein